MRRDQSDELSWSDAIFVFFQKAGKWRRLPSGEIARRTEVGQRAQRTNDLQNCASIFPWEDKLLKISNLGLVEAAGVEPASEIVVSQETPCSVRSIVSLPALRTDKKRLKLVR